MSATLGLQPVPPIAGGNGKYLLVGTTPNGAQITAFWKAGVEKEATRIHVATGDARFTELDGSKPGYHLILEGLKQTSADYNPRYFNRFARALVAEGVPAPAIVPEFDRHLSRRIDLLRPKTIVVDGVSYVRAN